MTLADHDTDRITAALERIRSLGKTSRAQEAIAVVQAFKGLYTLEQVELVQQGGVGMSAAETAKPTADFVLSINATTGFQGTTKGTCTPEQYAAAMAALHGQPTPTERELLEALQAICDEQDVQQGYATPETYDAARAAIAKATGEQA